MKRSWLAPVTVLVLCSASAPAALAVEGDDQGIRMSLAEAQRAALENNLDLVIARKDPRIAALNVDFQKAAFDPTIGAGRRGGEDDPGARRQPVRGSHVHSGCRVARPGRRVAFAREAAGSRPSSPPPPPPGARRGRSTGGGDP